MRPTILARAALSGAAEISWISAAEDVAWNRVRSVWVRMPTSLPPSTTGMWVKPFSTMVWSTSATSAVGGRVEGSAVMTCATGVSSDRPSATARDVMSPVVRIPRTAPSSVAMMQETWISRILRAASINGVSGAQVSGSRVIRSLSAIVVMSCRRERAGRVRSKKRMTRGCSAISAWKDAAGMRRSMLSSDALAVTTATPSFRSPRSPKELRGPRIERIAPSGSGDVDAARHDQVKMRLRLAHGIDRLARDEVDAVDGLGQRCPGILGQDVIGVGAGERGGDIDRHDMSRIGKAHPDVFGMRRWFEQGPRCRRPCMS